MSASPPAPPRLTEVTVAGIGLLVGGAVEALVSAITVAVAGYDSLRYHELRGMSLFPILGIAAGVVTILGGVHLLLGRNRTVAYAGAVASLVPGTLCCVLGAAFGVLALVILPRPEVRAHFGDAVPAPPGDGAHPR